MKKVLLFSLALCCLAMQAQAQAAPQAVTPTPAAPASVIRVEPPKVVSEEVFNHELTDLRGRSFSLSNYRGQVFVLNIWASWCGPCRLEIPELNKLYQEYRARGVEFVGLSTENPATDARVANDFAAEFKMKYKLGWLDAATAQSLMAGSRLIPQTFVVAPDGHIVVRFRGYSDRISQMLRDAIEKALSPQPASAPPASAAPAAPAPPGRR